MLRLTLFGSVEIEKNGQPVTGFRSSKAQALLCYLAVTGQAHTRPALAGLLWGELPETNARQNLSKSLTNLRRLVGTHLEITRQTVAFSKESSYHLDVETFTEALSHRSKNPSIEQLREAVELYRGDFLEGFYVPDAPALEEWVLTRRTRLREMVLQALHTLAAHFTRQGKEAGYETGIDYTARLLALEPWREEAHRQLMRLFALSGQRGAALAQFETCRHLLAEELGVEPGPDTKELYGRIRAGTFPEGITDKGALTAIQPKPGDRASPVDLTPPVPAPPSLSLPPFLSPSLTQPSPAIPVVARQRQLSQLEKLLDRILNGQGRVVFIIGPAGAGKTVLAEAFARQAQQKHPELLVANGRCNAYSGIGDPYLPFREILGMLTGELEDKWAAGTTDLRQAKRLWAMLPYTIQSLVSTSPDLLDIFVSGSALLARVAIAADGDVDWLNHLQTLVARKATEQNSGTLTQNGLFMQYTKLLQTLADRAPLLLWLDDLQWADTGSISLLFHLGQRLAGQPILIVGIYRPDDIALGRPATGSKKPERHPLEPVINEFQRNFGAIHLNLGQTEGREFVNAIVDTEPNRLDESFREALYRQTAGHALFTVEMLHGLQEQGDLVKDEQGRWVAGPTLDWDILPARVEGIIKERIDRLPPAFQEILQVASVVGESFAAEVVTHVHGLEPRQVIHWLGELDKFHRLVKNQGSRRIVAGGQRLSFYSFRHILFQKYLYNHLDHNEQLYLHEAVGQAVEKLYGEQASQIPVQLARHFRQAGILPKAVHYLQLAGQQALRSYANLEAIHLFRNALDLLKTLPETPERIQRELNLHLTMIPPLIATEGYSAPAVGQASARAHELCAANETTPELFYALRGLWVFRFVRAEIRQAHEYSRQLLGLAEALEDPAFLLDAHHALAGSSCILGDFTQSRRHFEQAITLYEPQQHQTQVLFFGPDLGVFCYSWIAHPLCHLGYLDQARGASQEALRMAEALDHPFSLALGLAYGAMLQQFCQNVAATKELAERAIAVCREHNFVYYLAWAKILLGWARAQLHPAQEAVDQMREGLNDLLATEAGLREPYYLTLLAEANGQIGQFEEGLILLDEALTEARERGDRWYEAESYRLRGELLRQNGVHQSEVEASFLRAMEIARQQQARLQELRATMSLARLWQGQGRKEAEHRQLADSYNWFSEGFDTPDLKEARALLAEFE